LLATLHTTNRVSYVGSVMFSTLLWVVMIWTVTSFSIVGVWVALCYGCAALSRVKRSGFRLPVGPGMRGGSRTRVSSHAA
jgi:hypothetical protein